MRRGRPAPPPCTPGAASATRPCRERRGLRSRSGSLRTSDGRSGGTSPWENRRPANLRGDRPSPPPPRHPATSAKTDNPGRARERLRSGRLAARSGTRRGTSPLARSRPGTRHRSGRSCAPDHSRSLSSPGSTCQAGQAARRKRPRPGETRSRRSSARSVARSRSRAARAGRLHRAQRFVLVVSRCSTTASCRGSNESTMNAPSSRGHAPRETRMRHPRRRRRGRRERPMPADRRSCSRRRAYRRPGRAAAAPARSPGLAAERTALTPSASNIGLSSNGAGSRLRPREPIEDARLDEGLARSASTGRRTARRARGCPAVRARPQCSDTAWRRSRTHVNGARLPERFEQAASNPESRNGSALFA